MLSFVNDDDNENDDGKNSSVVVTVDITVDKSAWHNVISHGQRTDRTRMTVYDGVAVVRGTAVKRRQAVTDSRKLCKEANLQ